MTTKLTNPSSPSEPSTGAGRDRLVHDHLEYARALAAKLRRELQTDLPLEELEGYAMQGLVEAAGRFDPSRGATFKTFAYYRIRGAILDGLRQTGWLNRSEYGRYQAATNELLGNLSQRRPPEAQRATTIEDELSQVAETLDQVTTIFVAVTEATDEIADDRAPDAGALVESRQQHRQVRSALHQLPERERQIIELHYFRGLTLQAAGTKLGLSKSWASRLHARAIRLLTDTLQT